MMSNRNAGAKADWRTWLEALVVGGLLIWGYVALLHGLARRLDLQRLGPS